MQQTFKFSEAGVKLMMRKSKKRAFIVFGCITLFIPLTIYIINRQLNSSFYLTILILLIVVIFGIHTSNKKNLKIYESFNIIIDEDIFIRDANGLVKLEIFKHDITLAEENINGDIFY